MQLRWPTSRAEIAKVQSVRKRRAVELAMRAPFFRDRLRGIDLDRLDDPAVWAKIPLLTKDQLRQIPADKFHKQFCVAPRRDVVEYWRSGGVTGKPLFYPRSAEDMEYSIMCFRRAFAVVGATPEDMVHVSFPLGIHPVAHLYARAAEDLGIGAAGESHPRPQEDVARLQGRHLHLLDAHVLPAVEHGRFHLRSHECSPR